jgi:hypothetical protein
MTPGYQTTEFWLTIVAKLIALAVTLGVLSAAQGEAWQTALCQLVMGAFAVASIIGLARQYLQERTRLKQHHLTSGRDEPPPDILKLTPPAP